MENKPWISIIGFLLGAFSVFAVIFLNFDANITIRYIVFTTSVSGIVICLFGINNKKENKHLCAVGLILNSWLPVWLIITNI